MELFAWKSLLLEMKKINYLEKKITEANANKQNFYLLKWNKIDYLFIYSFICFYVNFIFVMCNYLKRK